MKNTREKQRINKKLTKTFFFKWELLKTIFDFYDFLLCVIQILAGVDNNWSW